MPEPEKDRTPTACAPERDGAIPGGIASTGGEPVPPAPAGARTDPAGIPAAGECASAREDASPTPIQVPDASVTEAEPKKRRGFHPALVLATVAVVLGIIYTFPVLLMRVRAAPNEAQALAMLRTFARRATLDEKDEKALAVFLDRHADGVLPFSGYRFFLHDMTDARGLPPDPQVPEGAGVPEGAERALLLMASPVVAGVSGRRGFVYFEIMGKTGTLHARPVECAHDSGARMLESPATKHRSMTQGTGGWVELPPGE